MKHETRLSTQERKSSSRTSLGYTRNSNRQEFEGTKASALKQINNKSCINLEKTRSKQFCKAYLKETECSGRKNSSKLRNEESSDYIRNLYRKYLGKENSNIYSEKKLKTESKTTSKKLLINDSHKEDKANFPKSKLFADEIAESKNLKVPEHTSEHKRHQVSVGSVYEQAEGKKSDHRLSKRSQSHHSIQTHQKIKETSGYQKLQERKSLNRYSQSKQMLKNYERKFQYDVTPESHIKTSYSDYKEEVVKHSRNSLFQKDQLQWNKVSGKQQEEPKLKVYADSQAERPVSSSKIKVSRQLYCEYDSNEQLSQQKIQPSNEQNQQSKLTTEGQRVERFNHIEQMQLVMGPQNLMTKALRKIQTAKNSCKPSKYK